MISVHLIISHAISHTPASCTLHCNCPLSKHPTARRPREGGTGQEGSEMRKERMKRLASRTVIITPAAADTWPHIALAANLGCKCTRTKSAPPSTSTSERGVCRPRRAAGAGAAFSRHVSQRVSCVFGGDRFTYDRRSSSL